MLAAREFPDLDLHIESAGMADYHVGEPPDRRTVAAARRRGYDLAGLRARQVRPDDFWSFDYIIAMDRSNLNELSNRGGAGRAQLALFMSFAADSSDGDEVPDPYYGGVEDFERVLDLCERAARGFLQHLRERSPE